MHISRVAWRLKSIENAINMLLVKWGDQWHIVNKYYVVTKITPIIKKVRARASIQF
jgi:hypothetical protein